MLHWLQVRVPTHIVSSICDDRGEEPTYAGVTMSTLMEGDYCVGDVISLLWCVTLSFCGIQVSVGIVCMSWTLC